jgi:hypothetical protein
MADRLEGETVCDEAYEGFALETALEHRIEAMHELLDRMAPVSAATALKTLRDAFPDASLAQRVKALSGRRH